MAVPSFQHFIEPLLRCLATHRDGLQVSDAYERLATELRLDDDDRALLLPSQRQHVFRNRIGWAHDRLKRRGWSSSPARGIWRITEEGLRFLAGHPNQLSVGELHDLAYPPRGSRLSPVREPEPDARDRIAVTASPEELIEEGLDQLQESVARDLLERISRAKPTFFETLVLELLHTMGYGTSRADLEHVGGAGDGGIDGVISLDRLGLEKVFIQAKRWANRVGRPEVQAFYGALAGRRANKGVFITTSDYSAEAREFADRVEKIVLVDGDRLAALMIEHGVGVSHKVLKIPKVDGDYFEED